MRKSVSALLVAGALALGGCASGYGGVGGPYDVLGSVLGAAVGGSGYGYGNQNFEQAAVNACGNYASRYGRVNISDVRQQSSNTLRVHGTVDNNYQRDDFACSFRSDGQITDFDL